MTDKDIDTDELKNTIKKYLHAGDFEICNIGIVLLESDINLLSIWDLSDIFHERSKQTIKGPVDHKCTLKIQEILKTKLNKS